MLVLLLGVAMPAAAGEDELPALWQATWNALSARAVGKYVAALRAGPLAAVDRARRARVLDVARTILNDELSWERVGGRVGARIEAACSDEARRLMLDYLARTRAGDEPAGGVPPEYLECVRAGTIEAMDVIADGMRQAKPRIAAATRRILD
ncbi:MAG: hypothetical protein ACU85V_20025 [Gammaproteobacteria bacterium]